MKSSFEIRNAESTGIFIGFAHECEAMEYWRDNCERAPESHRFHGAIVVHHSWETSAEAETARLEYLLGSGECGKFSRQNFEGSTGTEDPGEWRTAARRAIDIARKAPPSTAIQIWPKPQSS